MNQSDLDDDMRSYIKASFSKYKRPKSKEYFESCGFNHKKIMSLGLSCRFYEIMNDYRIELVKSMGDIDRVYRVSKMLGYSTPDGFTYWFQSEFGVTWPNRNKSLTYNNGFIIV